MMAAILENQTPCFFFLHYDLVTWSVKNLLLVPHFAFPPSAITKRRALAKHARRAGWVGCNIALHCIPTEARISVIHQSRVIPADEVRDRFRKVIPLAGVPPDVRGWTLEVLNGLRSMGRSEFTTEDSYALEHHLEKLHPGNTHVRAKIRQQLQVLRDAGLLLHLGRGQWRLP
jgi:type II restriction enzyme